MDFPIGMLDADRAIDLLTKYKVAVDDLMGYLYSFHKLGIASDLAFAAAQIQKAGKAADTSDEPTDELMALVRKVDAINQSSGVDPEVYILEECSEVIKEITKKARGQKTGGLDFIEELIDIFTASYVYLARYGISMADISEGMKVKYRRAIKRYEEGKGV